MMQVSKRIPFDDPQVLLGVRILYVTSNLIIFGLYYYISLKIKAKRGTSRMELGMGIAVWLTEECRFDDTQVRGACAHGFG